MKDDKKYLHHILDAIAEIETYAVDIDWEDKKSERAIERCLEIIGEAANKLSKDFQKKSDEIQWDLVIGMRHKLIHDYFGIQDTFLI